MGKPKIARQKHRPISIPEQENDNQLENKKHLKFDENPIDFLNPTIEENSNTADLSVNKLNFDEQLIENEKSNQPELIYQESVEINELKKLHEDMRIDNATFKKSKRRTKVKKVIPYHSEKLDDNILESVNNAKNQNQSANSNTTPIVSHQIYESMPTGDKISETNSSKNKVYCPLDISQVESIQQQISEYKVSSEAATFNQSKFSNVKRITLVEFSASKRKTLNGPYQVELNMAHKEHRKLPTTPTGNQERKVGDEMHTEPQREITKSKSRRKKNTSDQATNETNLQNLEIQVAEEATHSTFGMASMRLGNEKKKIKFKRAKTLLRRVSQSYLDLIIERKSRFEDWSKADLVTLLIQHGLELRHEDATPIHFFRDCVDTLYLGLEMPPKPPPLDIVTIVVQSIMAKRIQNLWYFYQYEKRLKAEEQLSMEYINNLQILDDSAHSEIGETEIFYDEVAHTLPIDPEMGIVNHRSSMQLTQQLEMDRFVRSVSFHGDVNIIPFSHSKSMKGRDALNTDEEEGYQLKSFDLNDVSQYIPAPQTHQNNLVNIHNVSLNIPSRDENSSFGAYAPRISVATTPTFATTPTHKKKLSILDVPWTVPKLDLAKVFTDYHHPRKGGKGGEFYDVTETTTGRHCCIGSFGAQLDYWEEGQVSEFSTYGVGITNYFKLLKWCIWTFLILGIIALPALVLNFYGPNNSNTGLKTLAKTTVGNLQQNVDNGSIPIHFPGCTNFGVYDINCDLDKSSLSGFYAYLDIAISGVLVISYLWLIYFQKYEETNLEKIIVNTSMYTVCVSNIPDNITEEELVEHFQQAFGKTAKIASVAIAFDNTDEMEECMTRGRLIREKALLVHKHRYDCTVHKMNSNQEYHEKWKKEAHDGFIQKVKVMNKQIEVVDSNLKRLSLRKVNALYAYVTLDKISTRNMVMDTYVNTSFIRRQCLPKQFRIRGKIPHVDDAPDPSTIIWENLGYPASDRFFRRLLTTASSLLLVSFSLFIVLGAKVLQNNAFNNGHDTSSQYCPNGFYSMGTGDQINFVNTNPQYLRCYCDQYSTYHQSQDSECQAYLQRNISAQILTFFASMVVLIVNIAIEVLMIFCSQFEKHTTEDSRGESVFLRLFILKYINTSGVFFVNNNNVILQQVFHSDNSQSSSTEFSGDWFNTIGLTIILVQLGEIFACHAEKVWKWLFYQIKIRNARLKPEQYLTQSQMNQHHLGPKLQLDLNYSTILSTMFTCLTFSTGIPLLYFIAFANFLLFYWIEKYYFTRLYCIPPHYSRRIGERATQLIPIGVAIHLACSVWILSNQTIFSSNPPSDSSSSTSLSVFGDTLDSRISGQYTLPLFIFFCIVSFFYIAGHFLNASFTGLEKMLTYCCGSLKRRYVEVTKKTSNGTVAPPSSSSQFVSYTRAIHRNLIKGLKTYNLLQNPIYKEKFGITWKFAADNRRIRSLQDMMQRAQFSPSEDDAARSEELMHQTAQKGIKQKTLSRPKSIIKGQGVVKNLGPRKVSKYRNRSFYDSFFDADHIHV